PWEVYPEGSQELQVQLKVKGIVGDALEKVEYFSFRGSEVSFSGPLFTFEHPDYNTSAGSDNSDVVVTFKGLQVSLDCASGLSQIV
ncbi:unnamed protein product, partial [marine sediment metagenome]